MWLNCLLIVFLNAKFLVYSFNLEAAEIDAAAEWDSDESFAVDYEREEFVPRFKTGSVYSTPAPPLQLPESVRIPASELYKDLFKPERRRMPVSPLIQSILLPAPKPATTASGAAKPVDVRCHLDRIFVRVQKSLFTSTSAQNNLKLGTCAVNKVTDTHYYFLYCMRKCGFKRGENADRVTYTNTLFYTPVVTGPIVRELPFTVPIQCRYTKFHRSYQTGFLPRIVGGTLYWGLQNQQGPALDVMDESWNLLAENPSVVLGKPVCFEARAPSSGAGQRLYLKSCSVTCSANPSSPSNYSVIENSGCLVDSKYSALTKFYTSPNKMSVRLCVAAFLFKGMASKMPSKTPMFMNCELEVKPDTPTPTAKSCTYNAKTKKWTELYGNHNVCACCDSTCPDGLVTSNKTMITSKSWDLKLDKEISPPKEFMEWGKDFSSGQDDFELFWDDY